jgi:hypothetical protein
MGKQMFDMGARQSAAYSPRKKFLAQLARSCIHFVATHNAANEWSSQNRMDWLSFRLTLHQRPWKAGNPRTSR